MNNKLTNAIIDERLVNRSLIRISDYIDCKHIVKFKCLIEECRHIWECLPNNIIRKKDPTGCPKCARMSRRLSLKVVDERFAKKNIKRIGEYLGKDKPTDIECVANNCGYTGTIIPNDVFNNHGCPRCAGVEKLTEEIIDRRLLAKNIKRLNPIIFDTDSKDHFLCLIDNCGHDWKTSLGHVLNKSGCPKCSLGKNEKLVGQVLKDNKINFESQKSIKDIFIFENRKIKVDFYLPQINTIIEYNGRQHYQAICFNNIEKDIAELNFIKQKERDQYLQNFCDQNDIKLIWIDGRNYDTYPGPINKKLINFVLNNIIPIVSGERSELATVASNLL